MKELRHKDYVVRVFDSVREMDEFYGGIPCHSDGTDLTDEELDMHYSKMENMMGMPHFAEPGTEWTPVEVYMDAGCDDETLGDIFKNAINVVPLTKLVSKHELRTCLAHELGHIVESDQPYLKNPKLPDEWKASASPEGPVDLERDMDEFYQSDYYKLSEGKAIFFETFFEDALIMGDMLIKYLKKTGVKFK